MLQMASVYGVQQTAKQAPAFMLPHVAEVSRWLSFRPVRGILPGTVHTS